MATAAMEVVAGAVDVVDAVETVDVAEKIRLQRYEEILKKEWSKLEIVFYDFFHIHPSMDVQHHQGFYPPMIYHRRHRKVRWVSLHQYHRAQALPEVKQQTLPFIYHLDLKRCTKKMSMTTILSHPAVVSKQVN
jgi:hypothetical protein